MRWRVAPGFLMRFQSHKDARVKRLTHNLLTSHEMNMTERGGQCCASASVSMTWRRRGTEVTSHLHRCEGGSTRSCASCRAKLLSWGRHPPETSRSRWLKEDKDAQCNSVTHAEHTNWTGATIKEVINSLVALGSELVQLPVHCQHCPCANNERPRRTSMRSVPARLTSETAQ